MGNLHEGHLALIRQAGAGSDAVVVSIYVNPLQFDRPGDLAAYPRTLESDIAQLEALGVDLAFVPSDAVMYPRGQADTTRVEVPGFEEDLEGRARPGHFTGVVTVVAKLFGCVQPDLAVFGEKDYQQLLLVQRLASDLDMPVQVEGAPTVREADGLAMSSRNSYLTVDERLVAPRLYRTLQALGALLRAGEVDYRALEARGLAGLKAVGFIPDYVAIRRSADLGVPGPHDRGLIILAAAWLGEARLVDNLRIDL